MKKYKLNPFDSYYYYKLHKKRLKQVTALLVATCIILVGSFWDGTWKNDWQRLFGRKSVNVSSEVYLCTGTAKYDYYKAPKVVKGIYIPASKMDDYESYISLAKRTSINAFVIDFKDDTGYLTVETSNPKLVQMGAVLAQPPLKNIERMMSRLYEEDIYPIARIVAFKDNVATKRDARLAVQGIDGYAYENASGDRWLDPYNRANWEYLLEISKEAIHMGFKEIQFDYVRFHESMNESRVKFSGSESKSEIITEFIKYMSQELEGEGVCISADVFGAVILSDMDSEIVGQNFKEMSKYLDYICPMVYPSHYASGTFGIEYPHIDCYDIILKTMELASDRLKENERKDRRAIIRPWLQDFTLSSLKPYQEYGEEQIKAQIQGAYDAGLDEWLFWNAAGKYTEAGLDDK